ncbi:hypothetical protein DDN98_10595 [Vibrio cholerae]|uniref:hypothetical protein n=1 Tax=Vibrio cholerae TaxID=666 RepID=UPI001D4499C3|nr:hypothetical protein [Vibrio cholerae]EGR4298041.1 hypothetical protein [Vibrio cholerae]EKF9625003.1 hypothetical protein [Vibrio cholerae]EKF9647529.1 hypothetical protein [Vibrio cholerae]EKF9648880.1 hypothetical protein [Vibrio cholerae]
MQCSRCDKTAIITEPTPLCEPCALDTALGLLTACRLSEQSIRALIQSGFDMPVVTDRHYSATDLAKELGVSAQKVGKLANSYRMKTQEYGQWRLTKAANNPKQIETFFYNEKGRERIKQLLR